MCAKYFLNDDAFKGDGPGSPVGMGANVWG